MQAFWNWVDRTWLQMASVKLTVVVFVLLLLLAIPGTVVMQVNISNVDPGVQYDYDFWRFGQLTQLFMSYHSFWYVGLIALLAMNLIACSVERWPSMWKLATVKPVAWAKETFQCQPKKLLHEWKIKGAWDTKKLKETILSELKSKRFSPVVTESSPNSFQIFFQHGQWSRIANYLVHTSLLVIFAGAIVSSLYGFEGAANIPAGQAVDTFITFNEGKFSGLQRAPGGLINEKLLGFRLAANEFNVEFYPDFPGRPKSFVSNLEVLENGKSMLKKVTRVNDPLEYKNFTFYQASYGRLGDFDIKFRVVGKKDPMKNIFPLSSRLSVIQEVQRLNIQIVPMFATPNLRNLGPAVQFTEVKDSKPVGKPFWVLRNYPEFDFMRDAPWGIVVDDVKELFFTGLQISYDPGAPIYWTGCIGMLIGTFYALFVTHRKYYLKFEDGNFCFTGTIHRLPTGFENKVASWAHRFKELTA